MRVQTCAVSIVALAVGLFLPVAASAQSAASAAHTEAWLTVSALASLHPVDDTPVGSPYLDKGLGGVGPGAHAMLEIVAPSGATIVLEGSVSQLEVYQTGRLVDGRDAGLGGASSRLRDPLVALLGGVTVGHRPATLALVGGAGYVDSVPATNGERIDRSGFPSATEGDGWLALVAGAHGRYDAGGRVSFVASARFALVPRSRRAQELGASRHIVRLGIGLSFALNR